MAKLAIKGHETRGEEIIKLLEMLGGHNDANLFGYKSDLGYFITDSRDIACRDINYILSYFTLEEFLEKYPYKVGDKVILDEIPCTITWMCWECNNIYYQVQGVNDIFTKKVTAEKLKPYKGETMEDKDIIEPTSEINLNHPCFDGHDKIELIIPENWKFEQRGNKMFGIRKYPQYPTTYKECCEVLCIGTMDNDAQGYKADLIIRFQELIIARDAYWKIAGEQMGLGKPWEPDWKDDSDKYFICYIKDEMWKSNIRECNRFLVFPTAEMQDAFYENFKKEIEQCKELL
jgi:hypothetical protein